jgi:hypothetical protein
MGRGSSPDKKVWETVSYTTDVRNGDVALLVWSGYLLLNICRWILGLKALSYVAQDSWWPFIIKNAISCLPFCMIAQETASFFPRDNVSSGSCSSCDGELLVMEDDPAM